MKPNPLEALNLDKNDDYIIENQRGITVLGHPFFSPNLLLPHVDPPGFQLMVSTNGNSKNSGDSQTDITHIAVGLPCNGSPTNKTNYFNELYPLEWENSKQKTLPTWLIRTNNNTITANYDTDDQGWAYSWNFKSKRWKSRKGIVRKRVWVKIENNNEVGNTFDNSYYHD